MLDETWASDHILQTFLLDLFHVSLVPEHLANVLNLADVFFTRLPIVLVILREDFFINLYFRIVERMRLVVVLSEILLSRCLHYYVSLLNIFKELLLRDSFFRIEKCAASYLVQAVPLARIFRQAFLDQLPELGTV